MGPRKALGKGLGALIPGDETPAGLAALDVDAIAPNPRQPRQRMDPGRLQELAASIRAHGVLSPVVVRQGPRGYELVAGERRLRAAKLAGLRTIPALVKELTPATALEVALVENLQREDLNPLEEAEVYHRLTEEFGLTQDEVAARVGRDRSSVANALRLLRLPRRLRDDLAAGVLTEGHARALLSLERPADQARTRDLVVSGGLSVRQTEALVRRLKGAGRPPKPPGRRPAAGDPNLSPLEDRLRRALGTKVRIVRRGNGGTVEIAYYSAEDLDRILEVICGP